MYEQYDRAVQIVLAYLTEEGFSRTPRKGFCRAIREFRAHLADLHLEYSSSNAEAWLVTLKPCIPHRRYLSFRRALGLVEHAMRCGSVERTHVSYGCPRTKYDVPESFRRLLNSYLTRRSEDGCQHSALQMDRNACARFLLYLQSQEIVDPGRIEPTIVKAYHKQEEHRTVEGKNAYIRRVRGFLRYLASLALVPVALELALPTEKASRVSIVKTLSREQIDAITAYARASRTPIQLRSAAMTLLALRMGLRSVDICNLRLSDISWKSTKISIVQSKTGKPLTLPFPVEVGNALARYILEGRPDCDMPNVFVTLKHPYTSLSGRSTCYRAATAILGKKASDEEVRGLHIARKTYASRLLEARNPVPMISAALGHVGDSAIDEYLATDGNRMRQCAIGLSGIAPSGVLR